MHKKLMTTVVAIIALAALSSAPASATNFTENGGTLAKGASVTGLNNGNVLLTAGAETVTCNYGHIIGNVTEDAGGKVKIEVPAGNVVFKGTDAGDCTGGTLKAVKATVNSKLCVEVNGDNATINGCGGEVTFKIDVTTGMTCAYNAATIAALITTAPTDARVLTSEQPVKREVGQSFLCPAELKVDMDFTLTTTDGTTLLFS